MLLYDLGGNSTDKGIWLTDTSDASNFLNNCYGESSYPCKDTTAGGQDLSYATFITILPEDFDPDEPDTLWDCYDDPQYEIMVINMDSVQASPSGDSLRLKVIQRAWRGKIRSYEEGSQVRPLIWTNPNSWGSIAFVMNVTTMAPEAVIEGEGPFHWYDIGALFVADHHLKSKAYIDTLVQGSPAVVDDFYLADGIWVDGYRDDPSWMWDVKPKMFLHSDDIDLDLNDEFDGDQNSAELDDILDAWLEGYSNFFKQVRDSTKSIRGDSTSFYIVTNGQPDTSHFKYVNGRIFEDTNGWFQDDSWAQVVRRVDSLETDPRIVEPRFQIFFERDRGYAEESHANLRQMRLTMGTSLLYSDHAMFGVTGKYTTRSPVFNTDYAIEDYYDEFAVDDSCYGSWSFHAPKDTVPYPDPEGDETIITLNEEHIFDSMYYLGTPLDTAKTYTAHHFTVGGETYHDLFYREFDHGLVVVHYGACISIPQDHVYYQWIGVITDSMDILEHPWDSGYHFMGIGGCEINGFKNAFNDSTNFRKHPSDTFRVNLYGDGLILLKEGDGFELLHPPFQD